jgi:hypothetical protein
MLSNIATSSGMIQGSVKAQVYKPKVKIASRSMLQSLVLVGYQACRPQASDLHPVKHCDGQPIQGGQLVT